MLRSLKKIYLVLDIICNLLDLSCLMSINLFTLLEQLRVVCFASLSVTIVSAFFMGLVFSLQIVKEFLYLNAITLVGSILSISFLRELSPVLTSIILVGKVGSLFTSELATMAITEQVDALYVLGINPINYLILPRIISFLFILPLLNFISFITSIISSCFLCFVLYNIDPKIFFISAFSVLSLSDIFKSLFKILIFAFFIALVSCICGFTASGGSKGVGTSTTYSVVTSLLLIFILDFILSYYMFTDIDSSLKTL
uniref:ABC transporter permease n=1 Tax=Thuretia quercifolia TaxID=189650 RepID=A0A1Z1MJY0_9FLOR|nr:hypothetical protein [Thuretia quercifolia]ARW66353.1 hypothetical protein [Thuretia quercifolia]